MFRTIKRWLAVKAWRERRARLKAETKALLLEAQKADFQTIAASACKEHSAALLAARELQRQGQQWEKRAKAAEEKLGLAETTLGGVEADNEKLTAENEKLKKKVRHLQCALDKRAIPDGLSRTWDPEQA